MKKIFFLILFSLGITLHFGSNGISISTLQELKGQQSTDCWSENSGGGFWSWLKSTAGDVVDAISNVADAVATFFEGTKNEEGDNSGEEFGNETGDDNWYEPTGEPEDYTPPFDESWFQPPSFGEEEWDIFNNLGYWYGIYINGGTPPSPDCNGVLGGTATLDSCNKCTGGNTGKKPCKKDCAGVWGGTAAKDSCGNCSGGTSGVTACNVIPCQTDTTMKVTGAMLKKVNPSGNTTKMDSSAKYINQYMSNFNIDNRIKLAYFIANASQETDNFTHFLEDTSFSAKRLIALWPSKFDTSNANHYAFCACALDRAYAEDCNSVTHTNCDEASKDGSKYRGRGLLHLTHKDSYWRFNTYYQSNYNDNNNNFISNPDLIANNYKFAVLSALWEFSVDKSKSSKVKLNILKSCDAEDFNQVCRLINGGTNGLAERKNKLKIIKQILCL